MKIKIGIFFGGPSRQRELSLLSARSIFINLDRQLFEPVLILVNSRQRFQLLDWRFLFQPALQAFFPPRELLPPSRHNFPIYEESLGLLPEEDYERTMQKIGPPVALEDLPQLINFAVIAIHGALEADGRLQEQLDALRIPYTGGSAGMQQRFFSIGQRRKVMESVGAATPKYLELDFASWKTGDTTHLWLEAASTLGYPFKVYPVSDPANAALIDGAAGEEGFREAVDAAFFLERIPLRRWQSMSMFDRVDHIRLLTDLRAGLGFPVHTVLDHEYTTIAHPEELLNYLNRQSADPAFEHSICLIKSALPEEPVILESCIPGESFAITVCRQGTDQLLIAPPLKRQDELPGTSADIPPSMSAFEQAQEAAIRHAAERLFSKAGIQNSAVIEGKVSPAGQVALVDFHTGLHFREDDPLFLAGMQAGLLPSDWLTFLIHLSLKARIAEQPEEISFRGLLEHLEEMLRTRKESDAETLLAGVVYAHPDGQTVAPESVRQILQYLGAEGNIRIMPFLVAPASVGPLHATALRGGDATEGYTIAAQHPAQCWLGARARQIPEFAQALQLFRREIPDFSGIETPGQLSGKAQVMFLDPSAVELAPKLQKDLKAAGIGFSGPDAAAAGVARHRFHSLEALRRNTDLAISDQLLLPRSAFDADAQACFQRIESRFTYPFLALPETETPVIIHSRQELEAYVRLSFRPHEAAGAEFRRILRLKSSQRLPVQQELLFQEIIRARGAHNFLPLSIALLSRYDEEGNIRYEVLEPSERFAPWYGLTQAHSDEENPATTAPPARLSHAPERQTAISNTVRAAAETAARILHLQGAAVVELAARIYESGSVEPVLEAIQPYPGWESQAPLVQQLVYQGIFPGEALSGILRNSMERSSLESAIAKVQSAYITAHTLPVTTAPAKPETPPHWQEENHPPAMEPNPTPPSSRRKPLDYLPQLPSTGITGAVREFFLNIWFFISSAIFLKNLAAAAILIFLLFGMATLGLQLYTHHGQSVEVQDYRSMTLREAQRKARARSFEVVVNDSIYIVGKAPNIILDQIPKPGSRIKKNRNIYLTISASTPPEVPLPDLIGGNDDFEQYQRKLERLAVSARIKEREFNAELEDNTILYLLFEGRRIDARDLRRGVKVPKGSTVDFVVSIRNTGTVDIPNLVCMTYEEAAFILRSSQLVVGSVFAPGEPLPWLYVYKQDPAYQPELKLSVGEQINLYLTETRPEGCGEQ